MNDIYSVDFIRLLPPSLKNDPDMLALAKTIAQELHLTAENIEKNIIYARIDELDEQMLDILAYDLHIDWYDYSYPIEAKRATIKSSIKVHRRLGTKYAVETALSAVFPDTKIEEWFEYDGQPYTFRINIDITETGVAKELQTAVLDRVRFYKNLRSHLETIRYKTEKKTSIHMVGYHSVGQRLEIYPYFARNITLNGNVFYGGFTQYARKFEIYPNENFKSREV